MSAGHGNAEGEPTPARRPSQDPNADPLIPTDRTPLTTEKLIAKSEQLREKPDEVQQWLESLTPLAPSTKVPLQFASLEGSSTYLGRPSTFSDVLADWLFLWSSLLQKARKDRTNTSQISKLNIQLSWLLEFMIDYLNLYEGQVDTSSVENLTSAVVAFCLSAMLPAHISAALPVLEYIARKYKYPTQLVLDTMKILTASIYHIPDAAELVFSCLRLVVAQGLGIADLFAFVQEPKKGTEAKNLAYARGALRLLCRLVGLKEPEGRDLIDLHKFVGIIHLAASQQILRYAVDIMNACHTVLSSDAHSCLDSDMVEKVVDTVRLCLAPGSEGYAEPGTTASSPTPARADHDRNLERHLQERRLSASLIGRDLLRLSQERSDFWSISVIDYILQYPLYNPTELVVQCIKESSMRNLFSLTTSQGESRYGLLVATYLCESALPFECRIHAIKALRALMGTTYQNQKNDHTGESEFHNTVANHWNALSDTVLKQALVEEDESVLLELYGLVEQLVTRSQDQESDSDHATKLIKKLQSLVMQQLPLTSMGRQSAYHATRALIHVFLRTWDDHAKDTLAVYEVLTSVASMQCRFRECRIEAMKVLFRLRSTNSGCVFLTNVKDSDYIAAALCRTQASAESFNFELPPAQRHSLSSANQPSRKYECLWMYDDEQHLGLKPDKPSTLITVSEAGTKVTLPRLKLDIGSWLLQVIYCLQSDQEWETYCMCLVNAGSQLSNVSLFKGSLSTIVELRKIICDQIVRGAIRDGPPGTGLKKSDVALCLYNILTPLIAYATIKNEVIQKEFGDDLVKAFLHGLGGTTFEGTDRGCIHALSICALDIPRSVASQYPNILGRISSSITKSYLTLHILEFFSQVATLPEVHSNFLEEEVKQIFAMCVQFLEKTRELNNLVNTKDLSARTATPSARYSGFSSKRPPYRASMMKDSGEPLYASALAYHTMICWFLSLKLERRKVYVSWLVPRLTWKNSAKEEMIDEQSEVFIDMMQRTAFSDLGETAPNPAFAQASDGPVTSTSWVVGYSIITAETAGRTGLTQITKRQASGTTYSVYKQSTTPLPPHHAPSLTAMRVEGAGEDDTVELLPSHILLQMVTTAAPTSLQDQPVSLPKEEFVARALRSFDRISTVDSCKAGVLYIGPGQTRESNYLMAQGGSADYNSFLKGLGFEVSLQGPLRFNPQGLSYPRDGKSTIAWRDRVTEIVFLVPTMMPANTDEEPEWTTKKMHVGNCHVNIIFNRSGEEWTFDKLASAFNSINIIITPADLMEDQARDLKAMPDFYRVHVQTKDHFPNISPAADPKIVSAEQLPKLVRLLAINGTVFSEVWRTKDHDTEFPSNWRSRLQAIKRLKERVHAHSGRQDPPSGGPGGATNVGAGGRRTPVPRDDGALGAGSGDGSLAMQLDFGQWTS